MRVATENELLLHTLGLSERCEVPFRNHFVTGEGSPDYPVLVQLEALGDMERRRRPDFLAGDDIVFAATAAGRGRALAAAAASRPRLTPGQRRYQAWLSVSDAWDISFGDWLKSHARTRGSA